MRVLDEAQQRLLLRRGCEQPQGAGVDREPIGGRSTVQRERRAQRSRLRRGKGVEGAKQRPQELVQARTRELGLRLHAGGGEDEEPVGASAGGVEERRLADPRFAAHDERAGLAGRRGRQRGGDAVEFGGSPDDHVTIVTM